MIIIFTDAIRKFGRTIGSKRFVVDFSRPLTRDQLIYLISLDNEKLSQITAHHALAFLQGSSTKAVETHHYLNLTSKLTRQINQLNQLTIDQKLIPKEFDKQITYTSVLARISLNKESRNIFCSSCPKLIAQMIKHSVYLRELFDNLAVKILYKSTLSNKWFSSFDLFYLSLSESEDTFQKILKMHLLLKI